MPRHMDRDRMSDGEPVMSRSLELEPIVREAIRRYFESFLQDGPEVALAPLSAVTAMLPLGNFDFWEQVIRAEIWDFANRPRPGNWAFWTAREPESSWLHVCGADGFKRERAIRAIKDGAPDAFLLVLALRRLNDWVPQVRQAACLRIPAIVARTRPEVVVDALWSVLPHLPSWGRLKARETDTLLALIADPPCAEVLKSRIVAAAAGPSTRVLGQVCRTPVLDPWLGEIAATAVQPPTRAKAYRALLERRVTWVVGRKWVWTDLKWCKKKLEPIVESRDLLAEAPLLPTLRSAIADRSAAVRRVGAEFLIRHLDDIGAEARELAHSLADDASASVAERGKFALSRLSGQHG